MEKIGGVCFLVIATWAQNENGILRYGHFCVLLEVEVVNLGAIEFQIGLCLNINVDDTQNKFEVHISKNVRPKIGQDATFAQILNGHNSTVFHPILTFDNTKMISSANEWNTVKSLDLS